MFGKKKGFIPGPPLFRCSFCHKSQREVKKLIAGPDVYICDECVDICHNIVNEDVKEHAPAAVADDRVVKPPFPSIVLLCGLCSVATTLEESLAVPNRGILCPGCVGALEAALAERRQQT